MTRGSLCEPVYFDGEGMCMWIQSRNPGKQPGSVKTEYMSEKCEFNENGKARVSKEIGEHLVETYPLIEVVKDETKSNDTDRDGEDD